MTEQRILILGGIVGAAAGVVTSFLLFTERGQRLRAEAEDSIDIIVREAEKMMSALQQVQQGVAELRGGTAQAGWSRTA